VLSLTAATALAVVLAVAAWGKVRSRRAFAAFTTALGQFGVPAAVRRMVAALVPAAEIAALVLLVLPVPPAVRFGPAAALLGAFTAALLRAGRSGRAIACHCFGSDAPSPLGPHVAVNAALVLLAVAAALPGPVASTAGDRVLAIGLGLIAGGLAVVAVPVLETIGPVALRRVVAPTGRS